MNKKKWIYIGILIVVIAIVSIASFSYAFLTHVDEQHGKINIVAGTLDYRIESNDLDNSNSITLSSKEYKEIEVNVKSLNDVTSKYQLYTNEVNNVDIVYFLENGSDSSVGEIGAKETKIIKISLKNNTSTSKTIIFGVQGGLINNPLILDDERIAIVEGYPYCRTGFTYEFPYDPDGDGNGQVQEFIAGCKGTYKVELWGAEGSTGTYASNSVGQGKGAYTSGKLSLNKNDKLYVYVGESGKEYTYNTLTREYMYNGGGYVNVRPTDTAGDMLSSGGGATDIRVVTGNWDDATSLRSRVMVAAGGAGGMYDGSEPGAGGGLTGYNGIKATSNWWSTLDAGYGANQTAAGQLAGASYLVIGGFGYGGSSSGGAAGGGAGGSGWYGGSGGYVQSGGGGSSYISGYTGCVAVTSKTSSTPKSGCTTGTTNQSCSISPYDVTFINAVMIDGKGCNWSNGTATNCGTNQPQPIGSNTSGHAGDGYARITYLGKIILLNAEGGTLSNNEIAVEDVVGNLPEPTKTGYTFDGWYTTENVLVSSNTNVEDLPSLTLQAHYTPRTYTVTFNGNGGTASSASKNVTYDSTYGSLPTATRAGFIFGGWYTNTSYTTQVTTSSIVNTASNHTLYAKWNVNDAPATMFNNGSSSWGGFTITSTNSTDSGSSISTNIGTQMVFNGTISGGYKNAQVHLTSGSSYSLRNWNNIAFYHEYINTSGSYEIVSVSFYAIDASNTETTIGTASVIFASNGKASNTSGTFTVPIPAAVKELGNVKLKMVVHFGNGQVATLKLNNIRLTT